MAKVKVLEIEAAQPEAFAAHAAAARSTRESADQVESLAAGFAIAGLEIDTNFAPVPLLISPSIERGSAVNNRRPHRGMSSRLSLRRAVQPGRSESPPNSRAVGCGARS
jgi:hypothetical protein